MLDQIWKRSYFSCNILDDAWCCTRLATFTQHCCARACALGPLVRYHSKSSILIFGLHPSGRGLGLINSDMLWWMLRPFNNCRNIMQQCCKMATSCNNVARCCVEMLRSFGQALRSYDGNCKENVTLKLNLALSWVSCDYSMLITLNKIGGVQFCLLGTNGFHVKAKNERFTPASSRCRQNLKYENFTSSFA